MRRRICLAAMAMAMLASCYDVPTPACGFVCRSDDTCPAGYSCNAGDRICHLDGTADTCDPAPPDPTLEDITYVTPADGATNVKTNAQIIINFAAPLAPGSMPDVRVVGSSVGVIAGQAMLATDSQFVFSPGGLPSQATISVRLADGLASTDGRPVHGRTWSFMTERDVTGPMLTGSDPMTGATGVSQSAEIVLTFDEPVIGIFHFDGPRVATRGVEMPGEWAFEDGRGFVFHHPAQLPGSSTVTLSETGVIKDQAGNPVQPFTVSFETEVDVTPPTVAVVSPIVDATDVPTTETISISFSELMGSVDMTTFHVEASGQPVAGTIASFDGVSYGFVPDAMVLPAATTITVTLDASIADASGNAMTAPFSYSFTTAP